MNILYILKVNGSESIEWVTNAVVFGAKLVLTASTEIKTQIPSGRRYQDGMMAPCKGCESRPGQHYVKWAASSDFYPRASLNIIIITMYKLLHGQFKNELLIVRSSAQDLFRHNPGKRHGIQHDAQVHISKLFYYGQHIDN